MNDDFRPGVDPSKERVFLFVTQRRGGSSMMALDVTRKDDPQLLWTIDPTSDPALADLGQTWSTPEIHKIKVGGADKTVAIIGGGYDTGQDTPAYNPSGDNVGNAIYMIDITDGSVVWSAGDSNIHDLVLNTSSNAEANATMMHSIPAPVNGVDLTGNGLVDRIYAVDMGGRLWRFDVDNEAPNVSELISGGLMASLGAADLGAPTLSDNRRNYAAPDVVPVISDDPDVRSYLAVNYGSGHRAHPLEMDNKDWFFSVRDYDLFTAKKTDEFGTPVEFDDLIDITEEVSPVMLDGDPGWKLALEATGEKVFTPSFTFKGTVFFTSFIPSPPKSSCTEGIHGAGQNRLYRVSVLDGRPLPHPNDAPIPPQEPTKQDRYQTLNMGGIAPGPVFFFTDHDDDPEKTTEPDFCVGVYCDESGIGDGFLPTYWFQNETQ